MNETLICSVTIVSQLDECLKFSAFRGVLYSLEPFLSPWTDLNFRHLSSCDTIIRSVIYVQCVNVVTENYGSVNPFFPTYTNWKTIMKTKILKRKVDSWYLFCIHHSSIRVAQACLENISPDQFWSIANLYPEIVRHLHVQIRLMGNFGINGGVPWLTNTDGELCLFRKESTEDVSHFLLDCPNFRGNREFLWSSLSQKVIACNPSDGTQISHFFRSLDRQQKILLLLGGLHLPFDKVTLTMVKKFISLLLVKYTGCEKKCSLNWRPDGFLTKYICNFLFYLTIIDIMYFNTSFFM